MKWNFEISEDTHKFFSYWVKIYAQMYMTLGKPMDYNLPRFWVNGILQARILEWVAILSSRDLPDLGINLSSLMSSELTGEFFTPGVPENSGERFRSVQFSHIVLSDSLRPHGLQHARPPCPSKTPGVYSNSCPLNQWCHPTISSSALPFSSLIQSFPVTGAFQMSQIFTSGGQSIEVSASTSVLPMNIQDWFPWGWTGWNSLQSKGLCKSLLQHHSSKASILWQSSFFIVQLSYPYMTIRKTIALTIQIFVSKVMSRAFLWNLS